MIKLNQGWYLLFNYGKDIPSYMDTTGYICAGTGTMVREALRRLNRVCSLAAHNPQPQAWKFDDAHHVQTE